MSDELDNTIRDNSYARGIVLTLANDSIGTGPRLQMLTPSAEANRFIEREFMAWARVIRLPEKLRTMRLPVVGRRQRPGWQRFVQLLVYLYLQGQVHHHVR